MSIKRYGVEGGQGTGGQRMPFARATEADGFLFVSGQTPMQDGEVTDALGPYRASGHWWDDERWGVEEWDVEIGEHGLYRLRRDHTGWFIEGCYDAELR